MKILCISLGCDKNLVDTEKMLSLLRRDSYEFTDDESEADVILINTCCFIGDAKEESVNTILEMAEWRKSGPCRALIVTGCLAQRYRDEILKEIEEVDAVVGTTCWDEIAHVVSRVLAGERVECFRDVDAACPSPGADPAAGGSPSPEAASVSGGSPSPGAVAAAGRDSLPVEKPTLPGRILTTGGYYAFLKIAEGCDKRCTYCIIPSLRGSYRSVPMEALLEEARTLAAQGVKELILVAQETTLYGVDLYGEKSLPRLLRELCRIPGLKWIRIQYCYPEEITEELIDVIANEEKICHYLDLPIQHASDRILKRMGRRATQEGLRRIVAHLRERIPDITLRTTLITGFPGETQEDQETLLAFVDDMEFDRLGVFAYSQEEDTPAASFPDQIPEEVKEARRCEVMELQQEIAFEHAQAMTGRVLDVLIEGKMPDENVYVGRTYMDAPGVDGLIFLDAKEELLSGDFVRVQVTGAAEYDLIGEVYDESAK